MLGLNLIKVVDVDGSTVLDLRQGWLNRVKLQDEDAIKQALSGMYLSDLVSVEGQGQSLLVGFTPLKSKEGIEGGIILGKVVGDDLLQKISSGTRQHLVAFNNRQAIASTLPDVRNTAWQPPATTARPRRLKIKGNTYIAKSVALSGLNNRALTLVLLSSVEPLDEEQQGLWMRLGGFFLLEAAIAIIVGIQIGHAIARPIEAVTKVAQRATKEDNFTLQAPVTTKDEVGVLAISLNSLIRRVAEYTHELEITRETLERRVEERTEELSQKNQQLRRSYNELSQALQDLQQTQTQLIQAEKMSSLGQMVAGVAHEINNPINFIYGNLDYVAQYVQDLLELMNFYQQYYPNPAPDIQVKIEAIDFNFLVEDLPKMVSSMKMGTERIRQIVLSLRNFSRLDESEMKCVNLYEGIDNTLLILNHKIKHGIEVIKQYEALPLIECYPAQLNQVFMNILSNAIDALNSQAKQDVKLIIIQVQLEMPNQIKVRIRDNGSGIAAPLKAKIFEPFFTTKPVGQGTGLGLSISYRIIEKHQGKIEVISEVGQGTEFIITLPIKQ